jgi:hypothetical protein
MELMETNRESRERESAALKRPVLLCSVLGLPPAPPPPFGGGREVEDAANQEAQRRMNATALGGSGRTEETKMPTKLTPAPACGPYRFPPRIVDEPRRYPLREIEAALREFDPDPRAPREWLGPLRREWHRRFALARGWTLASSPFRLAQLAEGRAAPRRADFADPWSGLLDHEVYFRRPLRPAAPAGIVSHLYLAPGRDLHSEAAAWDLRVEVLPFSAYLPTSTTAIVLVPMLPPAEARARRAERAMEVGAWLASRNGQPNTNARPGERTPPR